MAWYALYKWFISWRKTSYINWISWYKQHLYNKWFNSLSEDEKKVELSRQQKIKEKRKHDREMALARYEEMFNIINNATQGRMGEYMEVARSMNRISLHPSKYW